MDRPSPQATPAADRARVVAIDSEIHELEEQIRVLLLEQEACHQRLDVYKYPVLTLPNEITSEIFMHFLPPYPTCPRLAGPNSPTSLTYICRQWREIALATPKLWRAFCTVYTYSETEPARVAQTWLERSGSCPLSIYMGSSDKECFLALLLHRERWRHVQLDLAAEDVALIKGPMPLLESLSLNVDDIEYTHPATTVDDFPRLRAVTLDVADHGKWLPISQLTNLTYEEGDHADYYLPLLHGAANLVRLNLIDCSTDIPLESSVILERLETLVLLKTYSWEGDASQIFETFTLPVLHTLHISGALLGTDPINSLNLVVARSGCKLQAVLVAGKCGSWEESFHAAFPSIPDIAFDSQYNWYSEERRGNRDAF
ncbi:hypothetical protein FB45DRAFT_1053751 [Roridomyces roridus]|uniref:F-box domain-containing protein n=1 Tax=Roridomyces roridus TaxID=1738132 RepID=A0AAD7C712_9AGAR|nr:hypothetical protein FB45DRAFT_1053751 [Roridomyces roridus]